MLGNFSFGDYFKRDAIFFAWELLTKRLEIPAEKLWVTVFEEDDEAADIWLKEVGVPAERLSRCGAKDNFWAMGDTGPCGPCSEIFYDHGESVAGGPPGSADADGDRYIEIWNLVFMQFDRAADGTLTPLPKPSVDTGMGLERLAAVLQGVHSNYEIDTFVTLLNAVRAFTPETDTKHPSLRVIADHIRSTSFMIVDGVLPSNEGRGYVLRRIIRRALRHGHKLGITGHFFHQLVAPLVKVMGKAYPELVQAQARVEKALLQEEERFAMTLANGMKLLNEALTELKGSELSGALVFKLYDTYGFPVDLTADVAREHHLTIDEAGFEREMQAQRERARKASNFAAGEVGITDFYQVTSFVGYETTQVEVTVLALFVAGERRFTVSEGEQALVVLNQTPFYAESGGQVGDVGSLTAGMHSAAVLDTQKQGDMWVHRVQVTAGELSEGMTLTAQVDAERRIAIARHHSATHLLHAALRHVLGDHVQQKGSLVNAQGLRFDFSHGEAVMVEQMQAVEQMVNVNVLRNLSVDIQQMSIADAKAKGAMALFGEKYGDVVRVVDMGDASIELCGGIHVRRTGEIGLVKIVSEGAVASGVRRIEAVAGLEALRVVQQLDGQLSVLSNSLKVSRDKIMDRFDALQVQIKTLERQVDHANLALALAKSSELAANAQVFASGKLVVAQLADIEGKALRELAEQLRDKLQPAVVVLASVMDGKITLISAVSKALHGSIKAGEVVSGLAAAVGGKGGGRPDLAQAGGSDVAALPAALQATKDALAVKLI
jgi:alanyl-tRNA synthetase